MTLQGALSKTLKTKSQKYTKLTPMFSPEECEPGVRKHAFFDALAAPGKPESQILLPLKWILQTFVWPASPKACKCGNAEAARKTTMFLPLF